MVYRNIAKNRHKFSSSAFTLVELIAIIIILGILALIAIPIVSSLVLNARKEAFTTSTKSLIKVIENNCNKSELLGEEIITSYIFEDGTPSNEIENINGKLPISGTIYVQNNCEVYAENVADERFCASGSAENLVVYTGSCDTETPTCSLKFTGDVGVNGWFSKLPTNATATSSVAKNSGLSLGVGVSENYSINVNADKVATVIYEDIKETDEYIYCYVKSGVDKKNENKIKLQYDNTKPTSADFKYTSTSNSIYVIASGEDKESGLGAYQFSIDNGKTWLPNKPQTNNTYKFSDLKTDTYPVKVRIYNGTYNDKNDKNSYLDSETKDVELDTLSVPTYVVDPKTYTTGNVNVTINYNGDVVYLFRTTVDVKSNIDATLCSSVSNGKYTCDGEVTKDIKSETWYIVTENPQLTFDINGSIIAQMSDGTNYINGSTLTISNIDKNVPTISAKANEVEIIVGSNTNIISDNINSDYFNIAKNGPMDITTICMLDNGEVVTNTSQVAVGNYTLTCTVSKSDSVKASASTNLKIKSDKCGVENIGEVIGGYICSTTDPNCFTCPSGKNKVQLSNGNWTCK